MSMQVVTTQGRKLLFTPERIDQIKNLVERGHSREEIAEIVGCTVGSLSVTCSRMGISLRRPRLNNGIALRPLTLMPPPSEPPPTLSPPPVDEPEEEPSSLPQASFTMRMEYRGMTRDTPLPLDNDTLAGLVLEAEMRGMRIGDLLAAVLAAVVKNNLFHYLNKEPK